MACEFRGLDDEEHELLEPILSALRKELLKVGESNPPLREDTILSFREAINLALLAFNASKPLPRIGGLIVSTALVQFFRSRSNESFLNTLAPNKLILLDTLCELSLLYPAGVLRDPLIDEALARRKKYDYRVISIRSLDTSLCTLKHELKSIGLGITFTQGSLESRRYSLVDLPLS